MDRTNNPLGQDVGKSILDLAVDQPLKWMDQTLKDHNLKMMYMYLDQVNQCCVEKLVKWTRFCLTNHEVKLPEQLGAGYH